MRVSQSDDNEPTQTAANTLPRHAQTAEHGGTIEDRSSPAAQAQVTHSLHAPTLAQNAATKTAEPAPPAPQRGAVLPAGTRIDRYIITESLGAGGMGVVYKAFDPQLGRSIAIKILPMAKRREQSRIRLLREAQALAQLSHPNVVAVYDSGTLEGDVFIAMELVQGRTLAQWLTESPRSQSEILEVFLEAAKGLAAVHQTGLIHRDFKPGNVMIGHDGRVRILDFGLVRMIQESSDESHTSASTDSAATRAGTPLDTDLTRPGALLGTPGYMAPEQFASKPTHARTDQFAFCISLYEALYGERPYAGRSLEELMSSVLAGRIRPAPRNVKVPLWLRAVLLRGLSIDPAGRWPAMDALIAALRQDPAARRRRMARAALAGLVLAAAGAGAALYLAAGPEPCTGGQKAIASVWHDSQRQAVRAALTATGMSYAADTEELLRMRLDRYAQDWAAAYRDACEATAVRKQQSQALLDQRMACLSERRQALGELVDLMSKADAATANSAVQAAIQLPRIDACADLAYVSARVKPPDNPALLPVLDDARAMLARAGHLIHTGAYRDARALAGEVKETAAKLAYPPLAMEADIQIGIATSKLGKYEEAVKVLEQAFFAAQTIRHDEVAITASTRLVLELGFYLVRLDDALRWAQHAEAALAQHGTEHQRATLLSNRALVLAEQGKHEQAERLQREALAKLRAVLPPDHVDIGYTLKELGLTLMRQGRDSDAEQVFREATLLFETTLGKHNPVLVTALIDVANAMRNQGKYKEADPYYQRALDISLATMGEEHADTALCFNSMAISEHEQGNYKEAEQYYRRALAIRENVFGPKHTLVAITIADLGGALLAQGDQASAEAHYRRALAIQEEVLGKEHPDVAHSLSSIGSILAAQGKYTEAEEHQHRALAIQETILGKDHPELSHTLSSLGRLAMQRGEYAAAQAYIERALTISETAYGPEHYFVIDPLQSLAYLAGLRSENAKAEGYLHRVLAAQARNLGKDHPNLAWALTSLGLSRSDAGDYQGAGAYLDRALALLEASRGNDDPELAMVLDSLGTVARSAGRYEEAERYYGRALTIRTDKLGPGEPGRAPSLLGLAEVHLHRKQHAAALRLAEEAAALWQDNRAPSPISLAQLQFVLARAGYAAGTGKAKAAELARQAEAAYRAAGKQTEAAEVAAWLARRGK